MRCLCRKWHLIGFPQRPLSTYLDCRWPRVAQTLGPNDRCCFLCDCDRTKRDRVCACVCEREIERGGGCVWGVCEMMRTGVSTKTEIPRGDIGQLHVPRFCLAPQHSYVAA